MNNQKKITKKPSIKIKVANCHIEIEKTQDKREKQSVQIPIECLHALAQAYDLRGGKCTKNTQRVEDCDNKKIYEAVEIEVWLDGSKEDFHGAYTKKIF